MSYDDAPTGAVDPTDVLGRRILAHCIDFALVAALAAVVLVGGIKVHDNVDSSFCDGYGPNRCMVTNSTAVVLPAAANEIMAGVLLGYWTVVGMVEGMTGAFVGKRITRLRVVAAEGGRAGPMRGAIRGAMMMVDSFACFLIGFFAVMFSRPRQRLGDRLARTLVVGADSAANPEIDPIEWDETRSAYLHRDPVTGVRQRWDATSEQWVPLD